MESIKIVVLCTGSAVIYGVLHDQVTARVCVEYFTIGHPPIFGTDSPTLLALGWGVIATWWVGLMLGIPVALASRAGSRPKLTSARLVRPLTILMVVTAGVSLLAGVTGYFAATAGAVWLLEPLQSAVPASKHVRFLADLWAHSAAYGVGFLGSIIICGWIWFKRGQAGMTTAV